MASEVSVHVTVTVYVPGILLPIRAFYVTSHDNWSVTIYVNLTNAMPEKVHIL